jgi:predicted aldo/keto reductase-like oxidoreductase
MINLPFGRGRLFNAVQEKKLPDWAAEFDCKTWAQFFLKYIVSHPAVTCAVPGMAKAEYVTDNLGARADVCPTTPRTAGWRNSSMACEQRLHFRFQREFSSSTERRANLD